MKLPKSFLEHLPWSDLDHQALVEAINTVPVTSLRLHPLKPSSMSDKAVKQVPWCTEGRYLAERPSFTRDPLFHIGAYYVQDASSMFLDYALRQIFPTEPPTKILDACAAPGGKSTLIRTAFPDDTLLVANEIIPKRKSILAENLTKWGMPNTLVTSWTMSQWRQSGIEFDAVIVDAPCSGEGLFRKDLRAREMWSPDNVLKCAQRQQDILGEIMHTVRPGGFLIYSTCTYNRAENEEQIAWLETQGFKRRLLDIPVEWGIKSWDSGCYHFFPHLTTGEGFFLAVMQRETSIDHEPRSSNRRSVDFWKYMPTKEANTWKSFINYPDPAFIKNVRGEVVFCRKAHVLTMLSLLNQSKSTQPIGYIGVMKGKDMVPHQGLALSVHHAADQWLNSTVDQDNALLLLSKNQSAVIDSDELGWHLVNYEALGMVFIKQMKGRMNNYWPASWRIRMDIR